MKIVINEQNNTIVCEDDDKEVGYILYTLENNVLDIKSTFVDPAYRGNGYADDLTNAAIKYAKENGHELRATCSYAVKKLSK